MPLRHYLTRNARAGRSRSGGSHYHAAGRSLAVVCVASATCSGYFTETPILSGTAHGHATTTGTLSATTNLTGLVHGISLPRGKLSTL